MKINKGSNSDNSTASITTQLIESQRTYKKLSYIKDVKHSY
jgi:hypothetical protein